MKMKLLVLGAVTFIVMIIKPKTVYGFKNKSAAYLLYQNVILDQEYKTYIRPIVNSSQATEVNISLNLLNIIDFNEVAEQLTITGELTISWIDEYLTWDPVLYEGLTSINIPQNNVWKPDIGLDNSVKKHGDMGTSSMYVLVNSDGYVRWNPMEVFQSTCPADVTKYPLDTQTCCLDFEAWNFADSVIKLKKGLDNIVLDHGYDGLPQWFITKTKAEEEATGGDNYVIFCITLKRQSLYVMLNIILPISLLSMLNSCVFLLPASSGEKASFSVTVFLALSVFLTIISAQLPHTSDTIAIFNLYVFAQVLISTFVTITALVEIRLYQKSKELAVPTWLRKLVCSCRMIKKRRTEKTTVVEVRTNENGVLQDTEEMTRNQTEQFASLDQTLDHVTWEYIADWLDPVMFLFYTCLNAMFCLGLGIWALSV